MIIGADDVQVQTSIQLVTGLPRDRAINTWAFRHLGGGAPDHESLGIALHTAFQGMSSVLAGQAIAAGNNFRVAMYRILDPLPRTPVHEATYPLTSLGSGQSLPWEMAICASFSAAQVSGSPPARRRGRVFIGPIASSVNVSAPATPSGAARTTINEELEWLAGAVGASGWDWCVYSRRDQQVHPVVRGWSDNAWDVQRRRGNAPTDRETWSVEE